MKRTILLVAITIMFATLLTAQSVVFHENFEAPSLGDSLTTTSDTLVSDLMGGFLNVPCNSFKAWSTTTNLSNSGSRSDSNTLQPRKVIYLTSTSFSTIYDSIVLLQFSHICKLHDLDGGSIEVSNDNGVTWFPITANQYQGSGTLVQNKFSETSYNLDWHPGDTVTVPDNSWWKTELFDISSIARNKLYVMIRFKYTSSGASVASGRYGWLIDDVNVMTGPRAQYTIMTLAAPDWEGTVQGGGVFSCGQQCTVKATPNPGYYFYCWSENGIKRSLDSIYTFVVTGEGVRVANFSNFIPTCVAIFTIIPDTITPHHYYFVNKSHGSPPVHYIWNWGDGTIDTTAFPSHNYANAGNYNICMSISDGSGCTNYTCEYPFINKSTNSIITVDVIPNTTTDISTNKYNDKIKLYPNPAKNNLTIDLLSKDVLQNTFVSIYNLQGQLLLQQVIKLERTELNINNLTKGMYIVKISYDKNTNVSKFVKE